MSGPVVPEAATGGAAPGRLLPWSLRAFWCVVLLLVGLGLWGRYPNPDLRGAVQMLADGDLDSDERARMLARVQELGASGRGTYEHWAALLAALARSDRDGCGREIAALGAAAPLPVPEPGEREFLHLGDTMLRNVLAAHVAEAEGVPAEARRRWQQVEAQSRMTGHEFAGELATAALRRLR